MCRVCIASDSFKGQFDKLLSHDKALFAEPKGWKNKSVNTSPLITGFETIWKQMREKYQTELSALAYRPIPDEKIIAKYFRELMKRIE